MNKTTLDAMGHPHSEALHLTERYRRRDFGHLDVELTVDDAKMYTRPFTIKYTQLFQPDTDILEAVCEENERDVKHMARQAARRDAPEAHQAVAGVIHVLDCL